MSRLYHASMPAGGHADTFAQAGPYAVAQCVSARAADWRQLGKRCLQRRKRHVWQLRARRAAKREPSPCRGVAAAGKQLRRASMAAGRTASQPAAASASAHVRADACGAPRHGRAARTQPPRVNRACIPPPLRRSAHSCDAAARTLCRNGSKTCRRQQQQQQRGRRGARAHAASWSRHACERVGRWAAPAAASRPEAAHRPARHAHVRRLAPVWTRGALAPRRATRGDGCGAHSKPSGVRPRQASASRARQRAATAPRARRAQPFEAAGSGGRCGGACARPPPRPTPVRLPYTLQAETRAAPFSQPRRVGLRGGPCHRHCAAATASLGLQRAAAATPWA